MTRYKCLVNGAIDEPAKRRVGAEALRGDPGQTVFDPAAVSVEFTVVPAGRWFTAGRPSQASMVLGTVPPGTDQATRVAVLDAMARLFCDATGAEFDDVMVVAADRS
jgi:hypothetical protein